MIIYIILITFVIIYIILSFIFLRKPSYIHKQRQPAFIARNIAHRGGAGESIENSLLAFDRGLRNGVEMLELDCHLTKDKQVVVHHDFSIERTTSGNGRIRDTEYDALPHINSDILLYYDSNVNVSYDDTPENRELLRIPLLKDVFERYPRTPINIDVKENNDELIRQVSELIQEYKREDITYWGSFSYDTCKKLTTQNPRIVRFCSLKEVACIVITYWLGLLPFIRITAGVFEVPLPGEVFRKTTRNLDWKFRTIFYLAERALNNKLMFMHLQRRGIPVYVWILNNEDEFQRAFEELSVTGVMTDYPSRLQTVEHRYIHIRYLIFSHTPSYLPQQKTKMAAGLVSTWNTDAELKLTAEQEEQLKTLLSGASAKVSARHQGAKQLIENLQKAVDGNDAATIEQLLGKLREGLRNAAQGRENFLDEFDKVLQPDQRARFLLYAVIQAKAAGKSLIQFIDDTLNQNA